MLILFDWSIFPRTKKLTLLYLNFNFKDCKMSNTHVVEHTPSRTNITIISKPEGVLNNIAKNTGKTVAKSDEKKLAIRAKYNKRRQDLKRKHGENNKKRQELFDYWTNVNCSICYEPMREIYDEGSPIEINEQYNINIIELPCTHQFHHTCLGEWFKSNKTCPYCRTNSQICDYKDIKRITLPRLPCRALILHSRDKSKIGQQCECLEYPGNVGFCKKHLVSLDEIFLASEHRTSNFINLVNRKLLTRLKLIELRAYPAALRGEILAKAIKILEKEPEIQKEQLLQKIENNSIKQ